MFDYKPRAWVGSINHAKAVANGISNIDRITEIIDNAKTNFRILLDYKSNVISTWYKLNEGISNVKLKDPLLRWVSTLQMLSCHPCTHLHVCHTALMACIRWQSTKSHAPAKICVNFDPSLFALLQELQYVHSIADDDSHLTIPPAIRRVAQRSDTFRTQVSDPVMW